VILGRLRLPGAAWLTAALAVALGLAACDVGALMPKEHIDFAKAVVSLVQNRDAEGIEAVSDPVLWQHLTPGELTRMAQAFPREPALGVDVVSYRSAYANGVTNVTVTLNYRYPRASVQAQVSFRPIEHGFELTAIHVSPGEGAPAQPSAGTQREM
jgi:hypothetical protein